MFALGNPGGSPDNLDNSLFGFVTVEFTDNSLTTSGDDSADLFVFEVGSSGGGVIESFQVEISKDASTWIDLGIVSGDAVVGLDIDGVAGVIAGDVFSFVRVTDAPGGATSGSPFGGPDIDAIGAISSAPPIADPPISVVPLPAAGWALLSALAVLMGFRRRA
ncbi:VPLPA-CTERM sorting domain-containing protein [uncultured Roseobacter sp.]|uniref:VPLPA-CTERM sorting domain-containing protein n=1 Tax=uncultured Roseobacter sp. TaxID=114847 RepID=UPI00260EFE2A|nr:VPLPA-CTERM sorting domain-containing protein [uncultured Roseobacter sp.]